MSRVDSSFLNSSSGINYKKIVTIAIALMVIGAGIWWFFIKEEDVKVSYKTTTPSKQDIVVMIQATGNLEPLKTVSVGIEVSGTLDEVLVDYNDLVKKNQVLAKIDTTKIESNLESVSASQRASMASVRQQEATLKEAQLQYERTMQIYKDTNGDYPSIKEIESVKAAFERAKASLESSKAHLSQVSAEINTARDNLRKAVVVSPIDGIVLSRLVEQGQTVVATMQTPTLFTLAEDLTHMQVVVAVDEADVGDVKEGQSVKFSVNTYPNKTFEGKVTQVRLGSEILNGVVSYSTVVEVDNSDGLLRPGMTAQASIITKLTKDAVAVPNSAFRFSMPSKTEQAPSLMRMPARGAKKRQASDELWILDSSGEPRQIKVRKGDSDGIVTQVFSDEINTDTQIVTGIENR